MRLSTFQKKTILLLISFACFGFGKREISFIYTPQKISNARKNIEKYAWASSLFDSLKKSADDAVAIGDDRISDWIPEYTPTRVVDCPSCGTSWLGYIWSWSEEDPDAILCRVCSTRVTAENYPDNDSVLVRDPQGAAHYSPVHRDSSGTAYFFRERLAYQRLFQVRNWLEALAGVYVITEEKQYAFTAIRFLTRLAKVYPGYALHDWERYGTKPWTRAGKISGWNYEDAVLIIACGKAYDATRNNRQWSERDREKVKTDLFRCAADFLTEIRPDKQIINDTPFRYAGVAIAGRILGDPAVMRWVLDDELGAESFIKRYWNYDGSWIERAPSYHLMALRNFHAAVEALENYSDPDDYTEHDRFDNFSLKNIKRLQRVYESLFDITYPNGCLPPINDSHFYEKPKPLLADAAYAWFGSDKALQHLAAAYGDSMLNQGDIFSLFNRPPDALSNLKKLKEKIQRESMDADDLGLAIIRSGMKTPETMITVKYGGIYGGHDHMDKLSLTLFSRERDMLSDLGYVYSSFKNIFTWMRRSLAHNTVTVDGINQCGTHGTSVLFHSEPGFQATETKCPGVYHTITTVFNRQVIHVEKEEGEYIVDLFRVSGGGMKDWSVHAETHDLRIDKIRLESTSEVAGRDYAYEQLNNVRMAKIENGMEADWYWNDTPYAGLRLHLLSPGEATVYVADAPAQRRIGQDGRTLPYIIVRTQDKNNTTFAAVWVPFHRSSCIISAELVMLEENSKKSWPVALEVTWQSGVKDIVYSDLSDHPDRTITHNKMRVISKGRIGLKRYLDNEHSVHQWINAFTE